MDNKKVIETIEKKLEVKVEKVLEVKQNGKEVIADVKVGESSCYKVVLKESKNQYGTYYRFVSASEYEIKVEPEPKKAEKKLSGKLRTKTEQLCGARRQEIISFAEKTISQVADGSARIKEIEGAALENTVIRFVLLMNGDDSRFGVRPVLFVSDTVHHERTAVSADNKTAKYMRMEAAVTPLPKTILFRMHVQNR